MNEMNTKEVSSRPRVFRPEPKGFSDDEDGEDEQFAPDPPPVPPRKAPPEIPARADQLKEDPRTQLELIRPAPKYSKGDFTGLESRVVYWCGDVMKHNHKNKDDPRVAILSDESIYLAHPDGKINRCTAIGLLDKVVLQREGTSAWINMKIGREYDMRLKVDEPERFVTILKSVHQYRTGRELTVEENANFDAKKNLKLDRPKAYKVDVAQMNTKATLLKALQQKRATQEEAQKKLNDQLATVVEELRSEYDEDKKVAMEALRAAIENQRQELSEKDDMIAKLEADLVAAGNIIPPIPMDAADNCKNCNHTEAERDAAVNNLEVQLEELQKEMLAKEMNAINTAKAWGDEGQRALEQANTLQLENNGLNRALAHRNAELGKVAIQLQNDVGTRDYAINNLQSTVDTLAVELRKEQIRKVDLPTEQEMRARLFQQEKELSQLRDKLDSAQGQIKFHTERDKELLLSEMEINKLQQRLENTKRQQVKQKKSVNDIMRDQIEELKNIRSQFQNYDDHVIGYIETVLNNPKVGVPSSGVPSFLTPDSRRGTNSIDSNTGIGTAGPFSLHQQQQAGNTSIEHPSSIVNNPSSLDRDTILGFGGHQHSMISAGGGGGMMRSGSPVSTGRASQLLPHTHHPINGAPTWHHDHTYNNNNSILWQDHHQQQQQPILPSTTQFGNNNTHVPHHHVRNPPPHFVPETVEAVVGLTGPMLYGGEGSVHHHGNFPSFSPTNQQQQSEPHYDAPDIRYNSSNQPTTHYTQSTGGGFEAPPPSSSSTTPFTTSSQQPHYHSNRQRSSNSGFMGQQHPTRGPAGATYQQPMSSHCRDNSVHHHHQGTPPPRPNSPTVRGSSPCVRSSSPTTVHRPMNNHQAKHRNPINPPPAMGSTPKRASSPLHTNPNWFNISPRAKSHPSRGSPSPVPSHDWFDSPHGVEQGSVGSRSSTPSSHISRPANTTIVRNGISKMIKGLHNY